MILLATSFFALASTDKQPCRHFDANPSKQVAQAHGKGLWIGGIAFSADDVVSAKAEPDKYTALPAIVVTFTPSGRRKFVLAQRCGVSALIDIWFDDNLIARPSLETPIVGPTAVIAGNWKWPEAKAIAQRIKPMPR